MRKLLAVSAEARNKRQEGKIRKSKVNKQINARLFVPSILCIIFFFEDIPKKNMPMCNR